MEQIQFLVNAKGERTGLILDFTHLKNQTESQIDDIEDIIVSELRKNSQKISWDLAKTILKTNGVID